MTSVYLQYDNEKPVKVPVRKPEAMPDTEVVIKNKTYRILSLDFEPIIEIFWGKQKKKIQSVPQSQNSRKNYDKWQYNMKVLKETGKYPKE